MIVTANYKMSYDIVRNCLAGRNLWLLVLETFGINVWCAAGKGSFGTTELVQRIQQVELDKLVQHRKLLLPILGAPGVAAHEVSRQTGFRVCYSTIRASDLPEYLDNGMQTTDVMRKMTFSLRERAVLIPVELVLALKSLLPLLILLFLVGWWNAGLVAGWFAAIALLGSILAGTVVAPLLLPWLPGASFTFKGVVVGLLWCCICAGTIGLGSGLASVVGSLLGLTAVSAFFAFNFTGSTPFTSLSGVRKEFRLALPTLVAVFVTATALWCWELLG